MSQAFETTLAQNSLAKLTALYNLYAAKPVKAFKDKPTALARVAKLATELGMEPEVTEDGVILVAPQPAPAPEPEVAPLAPVITAEPEAAEPKAAKIAKTPKVKAESTGKRGPAPRVADTDKILSVAPNPRRAKSAAYPRYALYTVGMTVGEYLAAAVALQGESAGRWRGDIYWDLKFGFITVGA